MRAVILDPDDVKRIIRRRRRTGADRFDEVWDGVYMMSPIANNEHQELAMLLTLAFFGVVGGRPSIVLPGINISDQEDNWTTNYRCPDVAVFLPGHRAQDRQTHWLGGPDLAVEVISRYDRARKKIPFYAKVGTRELILVDRKPWSLELYRLNADRAEMELAGRSLPADSEVVASTVLPLRFRLIPADPRPQIEISHAENDRKWLV